MLQTSIVLGGAFDFPIPSQATGVSPMDDVAFSRPSIITGLEEWTGGQIFDMQLLLPPPPLTILKPRLRIGYCDFTLASNHTTNYLGSSETSARLSQIMDIRTDRLFVREPGSTRLMHALLTSSPRSA